MSYDKTIDDTIEYILDTGDNDDFDFFLNRLSWVDYSENDLSMLHFAKLFDRPNDDTIKPMKSITNQLKVLDMIVSDGLKLNSKQKSGSFSYGHQLMRSSTPSMIKYALSHKFEFNQYTNNPKWHSLELLQLNYLSARSEKVELLNIIKDRLTVGVDLSQTAPEDFFMKLNIHFKSTGWKELIDLYRKDRYMDRYFSDNTSLIIKKEFYNLIPKEVVDIFVF